MIGGISLFTEFGAYRLTGILIIIVAVTVVLLLSVALHTYCDPYRNIPHLAKQWPVYLGLAIVCGACMIGYNIADLHNVAQFRDEGQAIRAEYAAAAKDGSDALGATEITLEVNEFNKKLDTLNQAFHFPGARKVLNEIKEINIH